MSSGASAAGKLVVVQAGSEPGGTRSARPDGSPVAYLGPAGITAVIVVPRPARELLGAER